MRVPTLSPRQLEILQALADGKSTKVIAAEVGVSYHTIDTHKKLLFKRIGVNSVHEAVAWAFRQGLVK